jgi:hypothetical protein
MVKSGVIYIREPIPALNQRPADCARASLHSGLNLSKTAPNLVTPPAIAEEKSQTTAKTAGTLSEEQA